tara:strand:- start:158 stop:889 length:732 start_codon:yes stop_codon:yes gene_type:complete
LKVFKSKSRSRFRLKDTIHKISIVYLSLLCICYTLLLSGCTKNNQKGIYEICSNINSPCEKNKVNIVLKTSKGNFIIQLDGDKSPVTVGNFLDLVDRGIYNGTRFHRVINNPFSFIIQGGDPFSKNYQKVKNKYGKGNFVDPKTGRVRYIPLEIKLKSEEFPRYNQAIKSTVNISNIELKHKKGSISMARSEDLDSASSQFYISLQSLPELDGRYSVFGSIVKGIEVIELIQESDFIIKAERI